MYGLVLITYLCKLYIYVLYMLIVDCSFRPVIMYEVLELI